MKKIRNKIWPLAVGVMLTVLSQPSLPAATYNVLFNNIEQGPNGTANPKINVANGKATKTEDTKSLIDEKSDEELLPQPPLRLQRV